MGNIDYTLITDGSSDQLLKYPLEWLLRTKFNLIPRGSWAKKRPGRPNLLTRVQQAVDLFPCDLLVIHRDAENLPREARVAEIRRALRDFSSTPAVCLVPVRMTEAWLLINEALLRDAAGNPRGSIRLDMPSLRTLENIAQPKTMLANLLLEASDRQGRRRRQFNPDIAKHRLAELIMDYSPLRQLPAFVAFEDEIANALQGR